MDQVKLMLKIHGFSWSLVFLVSRRLRSQPILGADFVSTTKMVLELGICRCYFAFAPSVCIKFIQGNYYPSCSQTMFLSSRLPQVQSGKISHSHRGKLERLINQYPDVLNEKLGLTHLMEYEIQLLKYAPVRLAPYRLAPPKM
jgi:hypothetical protein